MLCLMQPLPIPEGVKRRVVRSGIVVEGVPPPVGRTTAQRGGQSPVDRVQRYLAANGYPADRKTAQDIVQLAKGEK